MVKETQFDPRTTELVRNLVISEIKFVDVVSRHCCMKSIGIVSIVVGHIITIRYPDTEQVPSE